MSRLRAIIKEGSKTAHLAPDGAGSAGGPLNVIKEFNGDIEKSIVDKELNTIFNVFNNSMNSFTESPFNPFIVSDPLDLNLDAISFVPRTPLELEYFEKCWNSTKLDEFGRLSGKNAFEFFMTSKLNKVYLREIWSICVPPVSTDSTKGMSKDQFFTALRFVVLIQNGATSITKEALLKSKNDFHFLPNFEGIISPMRPGPSAPIAKGEISNSSQFVDLSFSTSDVFGVQSETKNKNIAVNSNTRANRGITNEIKAAQSTKGSKTTGKALVIEKKSEIDDKVDQLIGMFPDFARDTIMALLQASDNDVSATIEMLLQAQDAQEKVKVANTKANNKTNSVVKSDRSTELLAILDRHLMCPITSELFVDPVVTKYGHSYERSAIEAWLVNNSTDPNTQQPLLIGDLSTNYVVKAIVDDVRKMRKNEI
jgi:hypothetical protein